MLVEFRLRRQAAKSIELRVLRFVASSLSLAACLAASPVHAQVMDISPDGTVSVRQGAGAATWEVVTSSASDRTVDQAGNAIVPAWAYTAVGPAPVPAQ